MITEADAMLLREFNLPPPPVMPGGARDGWCPHVDGQAEFISCAYFEVLAEGNRGGGKTDVLLMDFAQHLNKGYGRAWRGLLLRRTYKELADIISKSQKWFPLIWPGSTYNQTDHIWTFPQGESLRLGYAEQEKDYWGYHGHEYPWIGWEELSNWKTPAMYLRFQSLCRSSRPGMPRCYRATTNPFGPGAGWIMKRWNLPIMRNKPIVDPEGKDHTRVSVFVDLQKNSSLLDSDPDYIRTLMGSASSPALFAAWILGKWGIGDGGMFDDVWDSKWNVVQNFIPPEDWYIDRAFDDGSSAPAAVGWFGESDGSDLRFPNGDVMYTLRGDLFLFKEWYIARENKGTGIWEGTKQTSPDIAKGIVERELQWGIHDRVYAGPADSAIFSSTHGVCIANDLAAPVLLNGQMYSGPQFQAADKGPGSRKAGWKQIRGLLRQAWPGTRLREKPGLFICAGCVQWQRTVPILVRDEKDQDDIDEKGGTEDHMGDMTRYRVHNPPRRAEVRAVVGST